MIRFSWELNRILIRIKPLSSKYCLLLDVKSTVSCSVFCGEIAKQIHYVDTHCAGPSTSVSKQGPWWTSQGRLSPVKASWQSNKVTAYGQWCEFRKWDVVTPATTTFEHSCKKIWAIPSMKKCSELRYGGRRDPGLLEESWARGDE